MSFVQTGHNAQANIGTYNNVAGNQTNLTFSGYARLYNIRGDAIIKQMTDTNELKKFQSIINLPRTQASRRDYHTAKKSGPCFEGTRVALLREMINWFIIPGESRMYALSGLAGIGKSTVAYTVAAQADYRGLLGASFFFSRDVVDRRTANKFFTTLAYQLCLYNEEFAQAIGSVLVTERGSIATTGGPQEQVETLILAPLRGTAASSGRPVLVVVDALDECDAEDTPSVISGLRQMVQCFPSFKVILTTRPQALISEFVTSGSHKIFHLQDIEDKVVNDDIRLYLEHNLSLEQVRTQLRDPAEQWYACDEDIESLVQAAGKLFIIASTAVLFILDRFMSDPEGQMSRLLHTFSQDRGPSRRLNDFYSVILRTAMPEDCDDFIVQRYQSVVGSIVVIQIPLPVTTLARLIDRRVGEVKGALRNLQSVILLDSDDVPHIYHKSFSDYVSDPGRCEDVNIRIDLMDRHTRIVTRCLEILNKDLKHNILCLEDAARFMDNEKGLAHQGITNENLQEKIPPELRYACIYWANHLQHANTEDASVMTELEKFADDHMLNWFEALSLIGELDSAQRSIHVALTLVKPTNSDLFKLLSDGLRFILKFYELIKQSALHTYYSALPFAPTESLLYRRYNKKAVDSICQVIGGPEKWNALLAIPSHGNWPDLASSVKFSVDSAMFASWNNFTSVKIWDAATGTPVSTISLKSDHVTIANDFSTIASAGNNVVTLYGVKSGAPVNTFTTSAEVRDLALSSESSRVAAWLLDGTICLWDTGKGKLIAHFRIFDEKRPFFMGSTGERRLIANSGRLDGYLPVFKFSPTGSRLICAPFNSGIIQLRDGVTGELIANRDSDICQELVISRDGSRFAALMTGALRLWKSEDGELVGVTVDVPDDTCSRLAITANGSLLATGHSNQVRLYSGDSLLPIDKVDLVSSVGIHSMTFSLDDALAVATDCNITVYNVKNCSVISTLLFRVPTRLAFSPDCTRLVAINYDGEMHLWNFQNAKASSTPSQEQAKRIHDLALSQDCTRLVCLFDDGIELWEISTTIRKIDIHRCKPDEDCSFGFSPDSKIFAVSFRDDETVRLWDSKYGTVIGSVQCSPLPVIALSNNMLAAAAWEGIMLWDLRTLDLIGTLECISSERLMFSDSGNLLACFGRFDTVKVYDIMQLTAIATFDIHKPIVEMAFLPDGSQLVAQFTDGDFLSFNLVNNEVTRGPGFNQLVQLRLFPRWHGIPVWLPSDSRKRCACIFGLHSEQDDQMPVLWIPKDVQFVALAQGSSMFALACADGQIIFVREAS